MGDISKGVANTLLPAKKIYKKKFLLLHNIFPAQIRISKMNPV
jgi:hypothetical protein